VRLGLFAFCTQEWDDALIPAKQKLRKGFKNANVGDGVFNLSSFGNMVRDIRGVRDDLSDIIIFNIFDDSIRMSEVHVYRERYTEPPPCK